MQPDGDDTEDVGSVASRRGASVAARVRRSFHAFSQVFRSRDLRYLELALGLNQTADIAYLVAVSIYAYQQGGPAAVGIVGLIRMVPAGIAGLFGAVVADRYRREWLLRLLYLGRAVLAGATALAFFGGAPAPLVYALAASMNVLAVLLRPAYWALLPDLARTPEQLVACNVVAGIFEGVAWLVGPALVALVIDLSSVGVAFVATASLLMAAVALGARVHAAHVTRRPPAERNAISETLAGVGAVARDRRARLVFGLFGAQTTVRGALNVLVVVAAIELLGMGEPGAGWLNSAYGVGGLVGAIVALALVGHRRLAVPFGVSLVVWGAPIALVAAWPNPVAALALLGLPGLGNAVLDVAGLTMLQRTVPQHVLGRVFGALEAQVFATIGIGSVIASGLIAWLGVRGALIATGAFLPALAALAWRRLREIDDSSVVPERELELLRGVPMFAPLPAVALEHLAASMEPRNVPARSAVFREGEPGDRFYLVASGEVEVSVGRRKTARLGPGGYFGEIALLRGVPRTATVRTRTDCELLALGSDPFLSAVSGNTLCADEADRVAEERMPPQRPDPTAAAKPGSSSARKPRAKPAVKRPPRRSAGAPARTKGSRR